MGKTCVNPYKIYICSAIERQKNEYLTNFKFLDYEQIRFN
jgi:hypothetical protein